MYQPPAFREDRLDVQHALIRAHPFATLVTLGPDGLDANHVPFLLNATAPPPGLLRAHVARANGQWRAFREDVEVLVIFQGPESYITPSWYVTKQETGKVVPTWNYAMVHVYGRMRAIEDAAWLHAQVSALTASREQSRPAPWAVTDAPPAYIASQLKGIVGLEIAISRIEGKWKVSQNRPQADQAGVVAGLRGADGPDAEMARLVEEYGAPASR